MAPEISDKYFLFVHSFGFFLNSDEHQRDLTSAPVMLETFWCHQSLVTKGYPAEAGSLSPCCPSSFSLPVLPRLQVRWYACFCREGNTCSICSTKSVDVAINFSCINPFLQVLVSGNIAWPMQLCSGQPALLQLPHHPSSNTHYPPQNILSSQLTACGADIKLFGELKCK